MKTKTATAVSKNMANKPKSNNVIVAIAIKPSPDPEEQADGSFLFRMCFVSLAGKKTYVACSKSIWTQITQHKYSYDHQSNFKLRVDPAKQMVTSIDRYMKPEESPEYFQIADGEDSGKVVLLIGREGEVSVKNTPQNIPPGVVDDIVALAQENPDVDADDLLGDRFMVEMAVKKAGQRTLTIDPTQR